MTFIDLFAGIGGFHIALEKLGHKCVFASEMDPTLQQLYKTNFNLDPHGDITKIDVKDIPPHDILCAGFPCQPFSKAGERKETNDKRGKLLYTVRDILKEHKPKYFILENVLRFKKSELYKKFKDALKMLYDIQDTVSSPDEFGIPQHRPRIFILGVLKKPSHVLHSFDIDNFIPRKNSIQNFYMPNIKTIKPLEPEKLAVLELWQNIIDDLTLCSDEEIYSPLWTTEFNATYPFEHQAPLRFRQEELNNYKGSYGVSLENIDKNAQIEKLPRYARVDVDLFPNWKIRFIQNNREYCLRNQKVFEKYIADLKKMSLSHQKLEWNVKNSSRKLKDHIVQFRPSGIRVSRRDRFPSLVSINLTQIPIIFDNQQFRYLTQEEALALQSFPIDLSLPKEHSKTFSALGNAINTEIVYQLVKYMIEITSHVGHSFEVHDPINPP